MYGSEMSSEAGAIQKDFAHHPQISNKALGIDGSSRKGTKQAATEQEYNEAVQLMTARDPGLVGCLKLERLLGLRSQEAIRSGPSLATWEAQLAQGEAVHVIFGTKGGRDRWAEPVGRAAALAAVREARTVAAGRRGHLLVGSLKAASTFYRNEMHRHCPITGHSLRYAYAQQLKANFMQRGYSLKEAKALVSISLGHGDGRGQYVDQVYAREG